MADLILPLNAKYFNQIKSGTKTEEYRLCNAYWRKRIEGKTYDRIVLTLGYPKKDDTDRRLVLPWKGYTKLTITHPHFGENPVAVYAIAVTQTPMRSES
jgi:hypothetical protein